MCPEGTIDVEDLPELQGRTTRPEALPRAPEADWLQALREAHWNVSAVARQTGLSRMTLYRRMKRAGVVPPNRAESPTTE